MLRVDLWNPDCWRAQSFNRTTRRESLERLAGSLSTGPALVGGDFNAPAGDAAMRPLAAAGLRDAFPLAGSGWDNSFENSLPVHRIDQLWSRGLRAVRVETRRSDASDHRMVLGWFEPS
ncbi:MAG: hypothetical protein AMXMBFR33_44520 [Candidatus Xenobia bacterium]